MNNIDNKINQLNEVIDSILQKNKPIERIVKDSALEEVIKSIPFQSQRQYSTLDQLLYLKEVANRLGLYDAADIIQNLISNL